jgi:hypothetical protein
MGRLKFYRIKRLITLTSDYIRLFQLYLSLSKKISVLREKGREEGEDFVVLFKAVVLNQRVVKDLQ